ncbi:MAG: DUF58 domain-containing protein [Myxococcales bacterium]|nr:DUF58 domain-containing protein [Myxococcales bacterium]
MASSGQRAQRRAKKVGSGIEFADHRSYSPGDDPRHIDWKVFGRSERLLLRQYEEEEDLSVYFLLDRSSSMGMAPVGERSLFERALQITAALSYISLSNLDRVAVVPFADRSARPQRPVRGKGQFFSILRQLSALELGGQTHLKAALRDFPRYRPRRGLVVILSDLYDVEGLGDSLRYLRLNGFEPMVVQLGDERLFSSDHWGDLAFVDCETGERREVTLTPALLRAYHEAFERLSARVSATTREVGAKYLRVDVSVPFDEVVMKLFRSGGFLG